MALIVAREVSNGQSLLGSPYAGLVNDEVPDPTVLADWPHVIDRRRVRDTAVTHLAENGCETSRSAET
jgi:hypothetical protein